MKSTAANGIIGVGATWGVTAVNYLGEIKDALGIISLLIGIVVGLVTLRNLLRQKP